MFIKMDDEKQVVINKARSVLMAYCADIENTINRFDAPELQKTRTYNFILRGMLHALDELTGADIDFSVFPDVAPVESVPDSSGDDGDDWWKHRG